MFYTFEVAVALAHFPLSGLAKKHEREVREAFLCHTILSPLAAYGANGEIQRRKCRAFRMSAPEPSGWDTPLLSMSRTPVITFACGGEKRKRVICCER